MTITKETEKEEIVSALHDYFLTYLSDAKYCEMERRGYEFDFFEEFNNDDKCADYAIAEAAKGKKVHLYYSSLGMRGIRTFIVASK